MLSMSRGAFMQRAVRSWLFLAWVGWSGGILLFSSRAVLAHGNGPRCISADKVNSPGCWKHRSDAELQPLLEGTANHPLALPVVCGETVETPAEARAILSTGGSNPCKEFKRDALTAILNIRRSVLSGDGLLGQDKMTCFCASDFCIVLRCGSFFVPNTSTPDPNDALSVTQDTPFELIVEYGSLLCQAASCPPTNNSTCGQTINSLASKLNAANKCSSRHGECGTCSGDGTAPTLQCPTGIIDFECTGPDGGPINYSVKATDNCDSNPRLSCYPPPGTVIPTGTMRQVDCTAKDLSGNTANCWFKVRVVDSRPPTICCPEGPILVDCVPGGGGNGAVVNYPPATAFDLCDSTPTVSCVPPSGSLFPFGVTTVKCTATDDSGNMSMCTFEVHVVEAATPTLTCPGNIETECTSHDGAVVNYPPPMVSSTCRAPLVPTCSIPSGSLFPIGTTTVTCSATDLGGNRVECSFQVTVKDTHPPVLTCPKDSFAECSSPNGTPVSFSVSATDTCDPNPAIVCNPPSGTAFPVGESVVRCTAVDHSGNVSECSFKVIVRDTTPPDIVCTQGPVMAHCTIFLPAPGAIVNFPPPVVMDACDPGVSVSCSPPSGGVFPLGKTTVTCSAVDAAGNISRCTFDVLVVDQTPPMLACPGNIQAECSSPDGAIVSYPKPVVADECDVDPIVVCNPSPGSLFPMGTTTVTCRTTDDSGNSMECTFTVTVVDTMPPQVTCPADKIIECSSPSGARAEYTVTAIDSCDTLVTVQCNPPSGSFFPVGSNRVECVATDSSGNEGRCTFLISVVDTKPPTVTCPGPILAECQSRNGTAVTFSATATDDCGGSVDVVCSPPSGAVFPPGTTRVTCTATDPSGNLGRCEFEVTVVDTTPPTITCPQSAVVLECEGNSTAHAQYPEPSARDLCDPSPVLRCDPPAGTPLGLGRHTITCSATDASGNMAQCSFEVQVVDTGRPALNCPQDIVRECDGPDGAVVSYQLPTPSDSCSPAPRLVCLPPSGSVFPIGETTVTCTADDQSGNMVQCTFTVRVVDTMPPLIQCPGDIVTACTGPNGSIVTYTVTATDTCDPSPSVTCDPPSGSTFPPGPTTVTCIARDRHGNESRCSFTVNVRDTAPPTITCPGNFERDCVNNGGALVEYPAPQVKDDCDPASAVVCDPPSGTVLPLGSHLITCRATDRAGNSATCEFMVTVVDRTAPMLVCPPGKTVECGGPDGTRVDYPLPVATDACDAQPAVNCSPPSGSLFPFGSSEVVCTSKDRDGNMMQCTFVVEVVDTVPPSLTCPPPITAECTSSAGAEVVFAAIVSDQCDPSPTLVCTPPSGSLFPIGQTMVHCRAEDSHGNKSDCSFMVTVVDRTPPRIVCPPNMVVDGDTSGTPSHKPPGWPPGSNPPANAITATVVYDSPISTDVCQTDPIQVTCDPPSGTRLGFGTHTITCKARDRAGNESTCTFEVTVRLGRHAFIRSDANADGTLDIGDPIWTLNHLFFGAPPPKCAKAADANDDGRMDIGDALFTLNYTFMGGPRPPEPFPPLCGLDPTPDSLSCLRFPPCE